MKLIIDNQITQAIIGGKDHRNGNFKELVHNFLSAPIPNSFHIQKVLRAQGKNFKMDGTKYFMNENGQFATGFVPQLLKFAKQYEVDITIEDVRRNLPIFKPTGYHVHTPRFELYEHQIELLAHTNNILNAGSSNIFFPRGVWKAATNAGKTAAAGCLVKSVVNPKALFLVDSQDLFEQHIEYFESVFGQVGKIGKITTETNRTGKYIYEPRAPFTIAMVGTLASRMEDDVSIRASLANDYNIVIADECHYFAKGPGAKVLQAVNAGMRVLMSGTPFDGSDELNAMKLIGMSGKVLHSISKRYLIDNGFSMEPAIRIYLNPEEAMGRNYHDEYEKVISRSEARAGLIADLISKRTQRKVLTTFFEKKHGFLMYDTFITKYPELADKCTWVHGSDKYRKQKIADYRSGKITRLFTSTIMQQGIDIPDIQTIIYGQGEVEKIALSQFMGRGERLDGIDRRFEYIDFWDRGRYVAGQSKKRIQFYLKEELEVKCKYRATPLGTPKA